MKEFAISMLVVSSTALADPPAESSVQEIFEVSGAKIDTEKYSRSDNYQIKERRRFQLNK